MYSTLAYGVAQGVVELPYIAVSSLAFISSFYFLVGFKDDAEHFLKYYFVHFIIGVSFNGASHLFATIMPDEITAGTCTCLWICRQL